jgi:hypothetical protein
MGLYFRPRKEVHLFERDQRHGSKEASVRILSWGDPILEKIIPEDLYQQLEVRTFTFATKIKCFLQERRLCNLRWSL